MRQNTMLDVSHFLCRAPIDIETRREPGNSHVGYAFPISKGRVMPLDDPMLDKLFYVLSDATRRQMLRELLTSEKNITELAEPFAMTFPAISKHVKILEDAGLVTRKVKGKTHFLRGVSRPLTNIESWLKEQLGAVSTIGI